MKRSANWSVRQRGSMAGVLTALVMSMLYPGDSLRSAYATGQSPAEIAVANPNRPDGDREADQNRKPAQVLSFFGIEPGMRVLDMFAGSGYYTEIVSYLVGPEGSVAAQNNAAYRQYAAKGIATRYQDDRLGNVERLDVEVDDLNLSPGQFDAALMILAYHDTYWVVDDGSWPTIDGPALLAEIFEALKPGGIVGVVDHSADPGGDTVEIASSLHRIEEQFVKDEFAAAGFVLEAESDILRNPDDDRSVPMFADSIRGKTDRFVLLFRKP